jgi:hypothetical protein
VSATARLLGELVTEVLAVPDDGSGCWRLVLVVGPEQPDQETAEAAVDDLHARLAEALEADLAAPLRGPSERLALGLYNDAYSAVAEAITTLGRHDRGHYWEKPRPMGVQVQTQLESYGTRKVQDIEDGLNEATEQDVVAIQERLVSVDALPWMRLGTPKQPMLLAPKPSFIRLV